MWFTMRSGIVSYDGYNWTKHSGASKGVWNCMVPGAGGQFWAINQHSPLLVSHNDGTTVHHSPPAPLPMGCLSSKLLVADDGTVIVGTHRHGVATLRDDTWQRIPLANGALDYFVYGLVTRDSELMIGAASGLWRVQLDTPTSTAEKIEGLPEGAILGMAHDGDELWIAKEQWIGRRNSTTGSVREVLSDSRLQMMRGPVTIEPDRQGSIYIGNHLGVHRVHPDGHLSTIGREQGLTESSAEDILVDAEGNVWIAGQRGLSKIVANGIVSYTSQHGLFGDEVTAICRRGPSNYVFGHDGGLTLLANGKLETVSIAGPPLASRVLQLDVGADQRTWIAASWRGLGELSPDNDLTWHDSPYQIHSVSAAQDKVMVATNTGLRQFANGEWSRHPCPDPVLRDPIRRLQRDGNGGLWGTTDVNGVWRLNANGVLQRWRSARSSENNTYAVAQWQGRTLVGSSGGLLEIVGDNLVPVTEIDIHDPVFAFVEDTATQSLWVGTTKGICIINDGKQRWIGAASGLLGFEVNRDAMFIDENGLACVGTNRGLNMLTASKQRRVRPSPRVTVTAAHADMSAVTFEFRVDSYLNEKAVTFRYRLEGLTDEWSEPLRFPNRELRFASLPGGDYCLHLEAELPDGRVSDIVVSPMVEVRGPIYLRGWFQLSVVLLAAAFAFVGMRYASNRRYSDRLKNEVDDRTRALAISEQTAKQDREQLSITMDSIADGVAATDAEGRIFLWNRAATQHTGLSRRDVIGSTLQQVLGLPEQLPTTGSMRLRVGPESQEEEGFEVSIATFGKGNGRVVAFRDITQRIANERDLAHRQRLESLGLLAGGIAHDFNNYLTVILGTLTMLEHDESLPGEKLEQVKLASSTVTRAEQLTKQLLTFSTGGAPVRATVPVDKLLHDAVAIALSGSPLVSKVEVQPDLPPARIDAGQVSQVLHNLILNARQAMPNGGEITVRANLLAEARGELQAGAWIVITVHDDGPGMSADMQQRIFDPFYSGRESTGLGLAVAHSIISRHGGTIRVQSELNAGTTFELLLPTSSERVDGNEPTAAPSSESQLRVLIMDDEPTIRRMLGKMLEHLGHTFVAVNDGEAAIASYTTAAQQGHGFDLAMFDLTVAGGIGGQEAANMLLTKFPNARIIAVSGYSTDSVLGQFAENGFCASLAKPFSLQSLRRVIAKVQDLST